MSIHPRKNEGRYFFCSIKGWQSFESITIHAQNRNYRNSTVWSSLSRDAGQQKEITIVRKTCTCSDEFPLKFISTKKV